MADHLWFIPATGGGPNGPLLTSSPPLNVPQEFNVQWNFSGWPTEPAADQACLAAFPSVVFTPNVLSFEPSRLADCHARWSWRSCSNGQHVTVGGQLAVGTVFSRLLNLYTDAQPPNHSGAATWNTVEAWVKFRLSVANVNVFDAVYFSLNDRSGNYIGLNAPAHPPPPPVRDWRTLAGPNSWFVAYAYNIGNWASWTSENLRATLTVLGTSNPAFVGVSIVDVEWFAIRLSQPG